MKLSIAIRLGAMLRPQAKELFFSGGGSCAMGAAIEAVGGNCSGSMQTFNDVLNHWPWLNTLIIACPETGERRSAFSIIGDLNDVCCWDRERIADFVDSIEPSAAPTSPACEAREECHEAVG